MDEQPKRRWCQFKLSTVLILTAIVAWGMNEFPFKRVVFGERIVPPQHIHFHEHELIRRLDDGSQLIRVKHEVFDPAIVWPALALAVFLAWKGA